jgi:hypothetical protein
VRAVSAVERSECAVTALPSGTSGCCCRRVLLHPFLTVLLSQHGNDSRLNLRPPFSACPL